MGVNFQSHIHRAMAREILDLLDVQPGLKEAGNVSVAQDMGCDMRIRQFTLDQFPHAPVGGLGKWGVVLHSQHVFGMGCLLLLLQPCFKLL